MTVYGGIDLHANNSVLAIVDERGELAFSKRYPNDLERIVEGLEAFQGDIDSIVVESTAVPQSETKKAWNRLCWYNGLRQ